MSNLKRLQEIANKLMDAYPESCLATNVRRLGHDYILDDVYELTGHILGLFAYDVLGLCGCGIPEDTCEMIRIVLNALNEWHEGKCTYEQYELRLKDELHINVSEDVQHGIYQFILYVLNDKGILEHGSLVGGSFLTALGKTYLTVLNIWHTKRNIEED